MTDCNNKPRVLFSAQAEAAYDRSIEALCRDRGSMSDER